MPVVLLIDDNPTHAATLQSALVAEGAGAPDLEWRRTLHDGLARVAENLPWAIFLNLSLPGSLAVDPLDACVSLAPTTPVVVLGGRDDDERCRAAMHRGAKDYLLEGHADSYAFAHALRRIRERDVARHELFIEKDRAEVTLNSIGDAVLSTDLLGRVTYLNVVAERMTGWSSEEAVGRPLTDVFHVIDSATHQPARNPLELAMQLGKPVGLSANCLLVRRDGHEAAIEDSAAPIHDRDGRISGAVIVFHDVSMARTMVLEMSRLAQHDALTGLPNRVLLNDRLVQALTLARRRHGYLAVLFLDVDGFKGINDSLGHAVGDMLLKSIAVALSACVRESDTVGRQGGDEFVILLPEILHTADAVTKANQIVAQMRKTHFSGEHRLRVSVSVGISTYPDCGRDAATLMKNADAAMYHAKEQGRDRCQLFDTAMNLGAVERQAMGADLLRPSCSGDALGD